MGGNSITDGAAPLGRTLKTAFKTLAETGKIRFILTLALTAVSALMPGLQVFLIGALVTRTALATNLSSLMTPLFGLAFAVAAAQIAESLIRFLNDRIALDVSYRIDTSVTEKLKDFELEQFESEVTYDLIQRVDKSTSSHVFALFDSLRASVQSLISVVSIVAVIATASPLVAFLLLVAPLPTAVGTLIIQTKAYEIDFTRAPHARLANYYRGLLSSSSTRKEVKLFNLGSFFAERYKTLINSFRLRDTTITNYALFASGALGMTSVLANVIAIAFGTIASFKSGNIGELAGYITAASSMGGLVLSMMLGITGFYQHLLYVTNWVALMELEPTKFAEGSIHYQNQGAPRIEFKDVSFTYPGTNLQVLNKISFIIEAGSTTAIVGSNGSGKTTLIKLLLRFYRPDSGQILINGIAIENYTRSSLYQSFSALFQDFLQYERSLGENITLGDINNYGDEEQVMDTLQTVGLTHLINELPDGLNTILGRRFSGGSQLSLGEWQRVAIARSLFRQPSLLILDEPTASVDAASEASIFQAMAKHAGAKTIILIAHRFTTIRHADTILVIDKGKLIGAGKHEHLMQNCKYYKTIVDLQTSSQL